MGEKLYNPVEGYDYTKSLDYDKAHHEAKAKDGDLKLAWRLLNQAHADGDPRASYAIASWYFHTHPPIINRKNYKKAVFFLQPALEAGIPFAYYNYAISLEMGWGIEKDEEAAFNYYLLAKLHGCEEAMEDLYRCYYYGLGVQKDRNIADYFPRPK